MFKPAIYLILKQKLLIQHQLQALCLLFQSTILPFKLGLSSFKWVNLFELFGHFAYPFFVRLYDCEKFDDFRLLLAYSS
jgi:hypothetical protein